MDMCDDIMRRTKFYKFTWQKIVPELLTMLHNFSLPQLYMQVMQIHSGSGLTQMDPSLSANFILSLLYQISSNISGAESTVFMRQLNFIASKYLLYSVCQVIKQIVSIVYGLILLCYISQLSLNRD